MLPTDKMSHISSLDDRLFFHTAPLICKDHDLGISQHLYIVSDDSIREGDWITDGKYIEKAIEADYLVSKKIIATTDPSLTKEMYCVSSGWYNEPLPRPSNDFIKKYCEIGGIDEIMVEYESHTDNMPAEEDMDLPWRAYIDYRPKVAPDGTISIKPCKTMWTRDEVIHLLYEHTAYMLDGGSADLEEWIEKNL